MAAASSRSAHAPVADPHAMSCSPDTPALGHDSVTADPPTRPELSAPRVLIQRRSPARTVCPGRRSHPATHGSYPCPRWVAQSTGRDRRRDGAAPRCSRSSRSGCWRSRSIWLPLADSSPACRTGGSRRLARAGVLLFVRPLQVAVLTPLFGARRRRRRARVIEPIWRDLAQGERPAARPLRGAGPAVRRAQRVRLRWPPRGRHLVRRRASSRSRAGRRAGPRAQPPPRAPHRRAHARPLAVAAGGGARPVRVLPAERRPAATDSFASHSATSPRSAGSWRHCSPPCRGCSSPRCTPRTRCRTWSGRRRSSRPTGARCGWGTGAPRAALRRVIAARRRRPRDRLAGGWQRAPAGPDPGGAHRGDAAPPEPLTTRPAARPRRCSSRRQTVRQERRRCRRRAPQFARGRRCRRRSSRDRDRRAHLHVEAALAAAHVDGVEQLAGLVDHRRQPLLLTERADAADHVAGDPLGDGGVAHLDALGAERSPHLP
jgi:hypothetical protein